MRVWGCVQDVMVGHEATKVRKYLKVSYPIENGIVRNWDDMEHIWNHTFTQMEIPSGNDDGNGFKIMLTEAPLNPPENKKKMMEAMFETYAVWRSLLRALSLSLSLYRAGGRVAPVETAADGGAALRTVPCLRVCGAVTGTTSTPSSCRRRPCSPSTRRAC